MIHESPGQGVERMFTGIDQDIGGPDPRVGDRADPHAAAVFNNVRGSCRVDGYPHAVPAQLVSSHHICEPG